MRTRALVAAAILIAIAGCDDGNMYSFHIEKCAEACKVSGRPMLRVTAKECVCESPGSVADAGVEAGL